MTTGWWRRARCACASLCGRYGRVGHCVHYVYYGRYLWPAPWTLLGLLLALPALLLGARARRVEGVLEVSGGWLGRRAAHGVGPFNVVAITLGHVVLCSNADLLNQIRAYEQVHVRQYERWGPLFVPAYLASSLLQWLCGRHPYRDNGFERPAFAVEAAAAVPPAAATSPSPVNAKTR